MPRMLTLIALMAVAAFAQEPAPAQEATLKVGDDAPLISIAKWVKGGPATLEKEIYVVEFWATWCGPCIRGMPHLSDLQETYKDKIAFIGVTTEDARNTLAAVEKMVQEKGPVMGYTVAWDDGRKTNDAWMKAAGQNGIPCCFVVDASGKIAYIGHPILLDIPLARLVAGKWDPVKGPGEIEAALKRATEILQMDRRMALDALAAFDKEYPELAWTEAVPTRTASSFPTARFRLLVLAGRNEEAAALGANLIQRAVKYGDPMVLNEVAWLIVDPEAPVANRDLDMAMNAATKAVELTKGEDGAVLDTLARVHYWKGDLAKAIEIQTKAVEKGAGSEMLPGLQDALDQYKAEAAARKE